ncbi:glycosyl hydrolase 53 family protein [Fulvivirgaceae bacterium BMA10]|uniref:Arabinogalactan endo-beta-1,4-galactanase n=1 Tax=Splendidivirga corallicola TaxID=3051826 RepID=A0ABT8KJ86_9BACT|nr:glycosyl hydrolase 53 family protein [Fulvivirgaceae bacterium BMA10]
MNRTILFFTIVLLMAIGCSKDNVDDSDKDCINSDFFSEYNSRNFEMGFSTWAYAGTIESVENTYAFIEGNTDIYSEHIDFKIPWNAWINDLPLPAEFTNEIAGRVSRKIADAKLTLSVSLLNSERSDLAFDFDGTIPDYTTLNDIEIEDAYFKHIQYITSQLNPDYLIIAIEVNELLKNAPEKWEGYKLLMTNVKTRIRQVFPSLAISESITLHNLYKPDVTNPDVYINELVNYANQMDFVSISFYPFFKGLKTEDDFQEAFDFLHGKIDKPIAFAETSHLSEDLSVDSFDLFIAGNQCEQNKYLERLLINAQEQNYEYIIWWAHRDYNELWETFPPEAKDLGKLWLTTGIVNEDGQEKKAYVTWQLVFNK